MVRKKRRGIQHVMEDRSYEIIKRLLPEYWVTREFNRPDYGIDMVIELFEKIDEETAETLGEYLYVQVKSVSSVEIIKEKAYKVSNVAKGSWKEDRSEYMEIDVIKYVFDTNSLFTIQSVGAGVSVLLFIVDISTEKVYFVCLNDFIDKIILPKYGSYEKQESITLSVPVLNSLDNEPVMQTALSFYGKRAKLLAGFSRFAYQKNEIGNVFRIKFYPVKTMRDEMEKDREYSIEEIKTMLLYFITQIEDLDIWEYAAWSVLPEAKRDLVIVKNFLQEQGLDIKTVRDKVLVLWHQLTNLGTMYEELCREWFLPKFTWMMLSYPNSTKIIKTNAE